jgi:hypothetical protein
VGSYITGATQVSEQLSSTSLTQWTPAQGALLQGAILGVVLWGGGQGGGGTSASINGGDGGDFSAGIYLVTATDAANGFIPITIGGGTAGGAPSVNPATGGDTSFASGALVAPGGGSGTTAVGIITYTGTAGGAAPGIGGGGAAGPAGNGGAIPGSGANGAAGNNGLGGAGGVAPGGAGQASIESGGGGGAGAFQTAVPGGAGGFPGGGGGAGVQSAHGSTSGGAGGGGQAIITYWVYTTAQTAFPPDGPTVLPNILPAYVFKQYSDDQNIQAFNTAFNGIAQQYQTYLVTANLPIYPQLSGSLLDWMAAGLYGITRPALASNVTTAIGPLATWALATWPLAQFTTVSIISTFITTDDIFKRIITWFFFKGDGQAYCTTWLKRRIMRFLIGESGTAPNIDNTYPVSVAFNGSGVVTITITLAPPDVILLSVAQVFQEAVKVGAVSLPFQYAFTVNVVDDLGATNLTNVGGTLHVAAGQGYPTTSTHLAAGALWANGGVVTVIPGMTPNPYAAPIFFGLVTAAQLLTIGGGNLPTSNPGAGTGQLWNSSNVVMVA